MPTYLNSQTILLQPQTTNWGNINLSGANILSVGLQNWGKLPQVYPTQLFAINNSTLFYQVDNLTAGTLNIVIWVVADGTGTLSGPTNQGSNPLPS